MPPELYSDWPEYPSGTRAELNQAIFESVATSVIVPGIQQRRADLLKEFMDKRTKSLADYTIEGAIGDAITYHGACSLDAGIAYAQKSIQAFDDIGIKRFAAIQNQVGIARTTLESFTTPLGSLLVCEKILGEFGQKLAEYKTKVDPSNPEQTPLSNMLNDLLNPSSQGGELRKEARQLDAELKDRMLDYAAATGAAKADSVTKLEAQQIKAKIFHENLMQRIQRFQSS
jgi:hypothetical protein